MQFNFSQGLGVTMVNFGFLWQKNRKLFWWSGKITALGSQKPWYKDSVSMPEQSTLSAVSMRRQANDSVALI